MKRECVKLLISHGYEVDETVGFIKENSLYDPLVFIKYDSRNDLYGLIVLPVEVMGNLDLNSYIQEIAKKSDLVQQLNVVSHRKED